MTALRFLLLVVLIAPLPLSAGIYKWTDAQGPVHYSDDPPLEAKAQQIKFKINSIQGPAVVSTLRDLPAARDKDKVRIYTVPWCGYCNKAKSHLAAKRVPYDEVNVGASERGRAEFLQLGGRGVPVILAGNQRMDGFDAARLNAMLAEAGG
jgi:glutaredoxin